MATHNGVQVEHTRLFLRPARDGDGFDVVGDYIAPASSVLAGQVVSRFLAWFPTEEEARANYPDADAGYSQAARPSVAHLPDGPDDVR